jgi:hypothetical protein
VRPFRTLVEAVRLTAAELLGVDLRELRATWMMHGLSPDIVLYDGVTGGAGYAHRVGGEISARRLLERTHDRLDCKCAGACRKCLFDDTNQRYRDAELKVIEKLGGHFLIEAPERFGALAGPFLDRVSAL